MDIYDQFWNSYMRSRLNVISEPLCTCSGESIMIVGTVRNLVTVSSFIKGPKQTLGSKKKLLQMLYL